MLVSQEHRAHIDPAAGVETGRIGLVVDNHPAGAAVDIPAADTVLYHHNPADVAVDHTVPDGPHQEGHHTAAVADNCPAAEHKDRVVVEVRRRTVVVEVRHNLMRRSGRSSPAAGVVRRHIAAVVDSRRRRRRRSCRSSRLRTLW